MRMKYLLVSLALVAFASQAGAAGDDRLIVVTGYHANVSEPFRAAFAAAHPGVEVTVLWRESQAAIDAINERAEGGVDVYWGASPANYQSLAATGRLAPLGAERGTLPDRIGPLPIVDADRRFTAFELAGYGLIVNRAYLAKLGLAIPTDWQDLDSPAYRGHVLFPVPSRQGTARLLYEILLQAYGWEEGWKMISRIAAQADLLPPDSAFVTDEIAAGRKGIGLAIDFFARGSMAGHPDVGFIYPRTAAYSVAQVGVLADAPHPDAARQFVSFLLSADAQRMLLAEGIERLPINPAVYREPGSTVAYDPYAPNAGMPVAYDSARAVARQGLVSALFDAMVTEPHAALVETWTLLREAERQAGSDTLARADLERARKLIGMPPISEADSDNPEIANQFPLGSSDAWSSQARQRHAEWRQRVTANLTEAATIARRLLTDSRR